MTKELPKVMLKPTGFKYDKGKDGWELVENIDFENEVELQLGEFLKKGETCIQGNAMMERAKDIGLLAGQFHAERLLVERIPVEWQDYYLVFAGTVWRFHGGSLIVPYLAWDGDRWRLRFRLLDRDFRSNDRLVRLCK